MENNVMSVVFENTNVKNFCTPQDSCILIRQIQFCLIFLHKQTHFF